VGPIAIYRPCFQTSTHHSGSPRCPFLDLSLATRSTSHHLHHNSPWASFHPEPLGRHFFYTDQVCIRMFTLIKYILLYLIIFRYCSRRVFGFHVCRYLVIIHRHNFHLAIWSLMFLGTFHPKIQHLAEFSFPLEAEIKESRTL
jgi:hypothetical protein